MIRELESALIGALSASCPDLSVEPFPDNPSEYEFIHPVGALLVQYDGGTISGTVALDLIAQPRELHFTVLSLTRNLRDHGGCYEVLDRVRNCLLGLKLPGVKQIYGLQERFFNETDGVWVYAQSFILRTVQTQDKPNYDAQNDAYEDPLLAIPQFNSGGSL